MIELEARLDELKALGLHRRTRLVSGPQGPHVLVDGKPALLLCSNNYLGLADHPRVRAGRILLPCTRCGPRIFPAAIP